jgi:predicted rRNA methylase YqxC with S4 and FtsJ domains
MAARYEYRVVQVREGLVGGKLSADKLEKVLNEHAREGWQVKAVTAADVKGRLGPGSTEGLLVTFERPVA